jgi:hypothetical protein
LNLKAAKPIKGGRAPWFKLGRSFGQDLLGLEIPPRRQAYLANLTGVLFVRGGIMYGAEHLQHLKN